MRDTHARKWSRWGGAEHAGERDGMARALRGRPERIKSDAQVAAKRKKKRKGRKKKKKKKEEGRLPSFLFSSLIHVFKIRSYIP